MKGMLVNHTTTFPQIDQSECNTLRSSRARPKRVACSSMTTTTRQEHYFHNTATGTVAVKKITPRKIAFIIASEAKQSEDNVETSLCPPPDPSGRAGSFGACRRCRRTVIIVSTRTSSISIVHHAPNTLV
jgi:hypothetical protein